MITPRGQDPSSSLAGWTLPVLTVSIARCRQRERGCLCAWLLASRCDHLWSVVGAIEKTSPGWQLSTSQIRVSVEKRTALARSFFRMERLTTVRPTCSARAVSVICRSASKRSRWQTIRWASQGRSSGSLTRGRQLPGPGRRHVGTPRPGRAERARPAAGQARGRPRRRSGLLGR